MPTQADEIARLLAEHHSGDRAAFDRLFALLYDDLRRIAHRHLRRQPTGHTLSTTALVHEAYLNLAERAGGGMRDRARFFGLASRVMRHVLVDYARRRGAVKRGSGWVRVALQEDTAVVEDRGAELLALDEVLTRLEERDPRLARLVECRYFGGMTTEETAAALDVSVRTAERDWTRAKAYLFSALGPGSAGRTEAPGA
jgi:RNA polymerase sigma factor (TIGR02999 family)